QGKGLHTGKVATMTLLPAPEDYGIAFHRTDIGPDAIVPALATNAVPAQRCTTLDSNGVRILTPEHILSALMGLGVDNALIQIDSPEVPILDGSARPYVEAIAPDGLDSQNAERRWFEIKEPFHFEDNGSVLDIYPADEFSASVTIDFNSEVIGVQKSEFDSSTDYSTQIAPCRTFCFLREVEQLLAAGLIKGGDIDNAIVVVDSEIGEESLSRLKGLFNLPELKVEKGYLSNLQLYFENECARHKMLDLIGDFSLLGAPLKGRVVAVKTGHRINTTVAGMLLSQYKK
ncbi:MAG: UDP-3-O-[3-hydroxymyristoyl] N-acetylglucosamine deacetylase, partial [Bacteroidales bacterium]|nr:UDP-3-O-[3-hydroxymyristoyl] N-acetylglucosamine deacetylase [Bacteroidales bacterium]